MSERCVLYSPWSELCCPTLSHASYVWPFKSIKMKQESISRSLVASATFHFCSYRWLMATCHPSPDMLDRAGPARGKSYLSLATGFIPVRLRSVPLGLLGQGIRTYQCRALPGTGQSQWWLRPLPCELGPLPQGALSCNQAGTEPQREGAQLSVPLSVCPRGRGHWRAGLDPGARAAARRTQGRVGEAALFGGSCPTTEGPGACGMA